MRNYIFGYGSLIEKESRLRTTPNAEVVFPIILEGYKRGWFARTGVSGLSTTFLGCVEEKGFHTCGVIYEVSEDELKSTDKREKGYKRTLINLKSITSLSEHKIENTKVWIYLNSFKNNAELINNIPSIEFPIVQSYVDICINGCIEIENIFPLAKKMKFTADFIKSTEYWNKYWVNDRIFPRRPFIYRPNAYNIDSLLKENLTDKTLFDKIYFE